MTSVTDVHEEKNTLAVDVFIPGHDPRVSTPLFVRSRKHLLERDGGRCWVCLCTEHDLVVQPDGTSQPVGPLEAHHYPIERSFAEMIDWSPGSQIRKDFPSFGWGSFEGDWVDVPAIPPDPNDPHDVGVPARKEYVAKNPYLFVDDMNVNGRLLCKAHHTGKDEGVHQVPEPVFLAQKYGKDGYKFSNVEIIHHHQEVEATP